MDLKFTVQTKINKPIDQVFDAVIDDKHLTKYFARASNGPLRVGQTVTWNFGAHGNEDVVVKKITPNASIQFEWGTLEGDYRSTVDMSFESLDDGKTLVKISEGGWRSTPTGVKNAFGNCSGWEHMAACLKAYLEHGIDLR